LRTAEVREKAGKGKHTTSNVQLHPLDFGGYVVDTPGIRELGLWDIWRTEMQLYFPEISSYIGSCKFSNCSHTHEPGCAVKEAVAQGKIAKARYDSYVRLCSGASRSGFEAVDKVAH
jgi:ribosome biogenesis GTPase